MTKYVFTEVLNVKRVELFDTILNALLNAGWTLLNTDTSVKYIVQSVSTKGYTVTLEILPFDGTGNTKETYDVRKVTSGKTPSTFLVRPVVSYDSVSDTCVYLDDATYLPIVMTYNRDMRNITAGYYQPLLSDNLYNVYYHADRDGIMFMLEPTLYTKLSEFRGCVFTMMRLPETDLLEQRDDFPSHFMTFSSGGQSYTSGGPRRITTPQASKASSADAKQIFSNELKLLTQTRPVDVDGAYELFTLVVSNTTEGNKFIPGGFYVILDNASTSTFMSHGDTFTAQVDGETHVYKYFEVARPTASYTYDALQGLDVLIRIK